MTSAAFTAKTSPPSVNRRNHLPQTQSEKFDTGTTPKHQIVGLQNFAIPLSCECASTSSIQLSDPDVLATADLMNLFIFAGLHSTPGSSVSRTRHSPSPEVDPGQRE